MKMRKEELVTKLRNAFEMGRVFIPDTIGYPKEYILDALKLAEEYNSSTSTKIGDEKQ